MTCAPFVRLSPRLHPLRYISFGPMRPICTPAPRFCPTFIRWAPCVEAVSLSTRPPISPTASEGLVSSIRTSWQILFVVWLFCIAMSDLPFCWPCYIRGSRRQWPCHPAALIHTLLRGSIEAYMDRDRRLKGRVLQRKPIEEREGRCLFDRIANKEVRIY